MLKPLLVKLMVTSVHVEGGMMLEEVEEEEGLLQSNHPSGPL